MRRRILPTAPACLRSRADKTVILVGRSGRSGHASATQSPGTSLREGLARIARSSH